MGLELAFILLLRVVGTNPPGSQLILCRPLLPLIKHIVSRAFPRLYVQFGCLVEILWCLYGWHFPSPGDGKLTTVPNRVSVSAELSYSLKVSDRHRNTPKSAQSRSESLCASLWVSYRVFWAWLGFALGPTPARNRAGSLKVCGALLAQQSCCDMALCKSWVMRFPPLRPSCGPVALQGQTTL